MNAYEMLYIIGSDVKEDAREAVIKKFEAAVTNAGGTVEKTDKWGMKKLAYPINFKNDGFYVLMSFQSAPTLLKELERLAGITNEIVRRMITKRI